MRFAGELAELGGDRGARLAYGTVDAISPELVVRVGASDVAVATSKLASYYPRIGDYVAVLVASDDRVVLGRVGLVFEGPDKLDDRRAWAAYWRSQSNVSLPAATTVYPAATFTHDPGTHLAIVGGVPQFTVAFAGLYELTAWGVMTGVSGMNGFIYRNLYTGGAAVESIIKLEAAVGTNDLRIGVVRPMYLAAGDWVKVGFRASVGTTLTGFDVAVKALTAA